MKRIMRAAALPLALALAIALPACGDDPPPTEPDEGTPSLTVETCIDCHSDEDALKATAAAVNTSEVTVVAAGDG